MSTMQLDAAAAPARLVRLPRVGPLVTAAAVVLIVIVVVAIAAPLLAPHAPNMGNILEPLAGPSASHPLGTDGAGRDLLSRLIYGARPSLLGPTVVIVIAVLLGTALTIVSVWRGGWVDEVLTRLLDVMFALPGLLLAIVAAAIFGPGLLVCALALSIAYIPYMARLLRGPAMEVRNQPFVAAYELQGFSGLRICLRHLLPAIRPFVIVQAAVGFGYAMIDLAALSFLGLGVHTPTADWGVMVADGEKGIIQGSPQESLYASILIVVVVVCVNVIAAAVAERSEVELP
jgi:peptide/nickel transport system permease protein